MLDVAGGWVNSGVGVLNLFHADGTRAQDQLTYTPISQLPPESTPEPATLALMELGGLVLASRKRLLG